MTSTNNLLLAAAIYSFGFGAVPALAQTTTTDTAIPVETEDDGDEGKWGLLGLLGLAGLTGLKRRDNHVHRDTSTTGRH